MSDAKLHKQIAKLSSSNAAKTIKIRTKPLKDGGYSVYLDHYRNGKRTFHFPKIYLLENQAFDNEQKIRSVIAYRDGLERDLLDHELGLTTVNWKRKSSFLDYVKDIGAKKPHNRWHSVHKHLTEFTGGKCTFADVDIRFIEDFKDYLLSKLHVNTASGYLVNVKIALNQAVRDGIINESPARDISIRLKQQQRTHLTKKEVNTLETTPCDYPNIKDAFLFGCYTGLRLSDIDKLTWDNVTEGYLSIRQTKTSDLLRNALSKQAIAILNRIERTNNSVFNLPSRTTISKTLHNFIKAAGIDKPVTFHISRHTYAIIMLSKGKVDLYTVSKMLGHRDIKTTQIYAHVVDSMKDEATRKFSAVWDDDEE